MNGAAGDFAHLPHDPMSFFDLSPGFDRKDLKRAYGKLIRQYKPETHPQEFQQIRQAYEQLESMNRYGERQQVVRSQQSAWESVVAQDAASTLDRSPGADKSMEKGPAPTAPLSITRQAIEDPAGTFRQLKQKPNCTPQDHFVMAVLSDLASRDRQHQFLRFLLAGLKEHPHDPGLMQLVTQYMRSDVPAEQASAVLLAAAKTCGNDTFYRVTEPLWERLLRERSFESFAKTLQQCETHLRQIDPRPRAVFYLRLLKPALFKAPEAWIDQTLETIESLTADLDDASENDLEFVALVREYQRKDRPRIGRSTARKRIDRMIEEYCVGDWRSTTSTVTQVLDELARDAHGMMEAFPIVRGEDEHRVVMITMMIAADVGSQTGVDYDDVDERKSNRQANVALSDLRDSLNSIGSRIGWLQRRYYWGTFALLVIAPPLLVAGAMPKQLWTVLTTIWLIVTCLAYFIYLKPRILDPKTEEKTHRVLTQSYESRWRSRLFRYVQSCGEHPTAALARLHAASQRNGEDGWMSVVLSFVHSDPALTIFGRAQSFLA